MIAAGRWEQDWLDAHINLKEAKAFALALEQFSAYIDGVDEVDVWLDNTTAISTVNAGSSKSKALNGIWAHRSYSKVTSPRPTTGRTSSHAPARESAWLLRA